jgi:glucan 1,3-beta-glucosidase
MTATPSVGNGWANAADTAGLMVNIAGCNYLDPWIGSANPPVPLCSAETAKRGSEADWDDVPAPLITPPPA